MSSFPLPFFSSRFFLVAPTEVGNTTQSVGVDDTALITQRTQVTHAVTDAHTTGIRLATPVPGHGQIYDVCEAQRESGE